MLIIATLRKVKLYLSKFVAFWNGKATSLQLTVTTIIILVTQTFFYITRTSTGNLNDHLYQAVKLYVKN